MFKENKYTKYYTMLTNRAKGRVLAEYTERHHIIPQSLGGSNDKDNLVDLTAREHFICHWLLIKMTEGESRSKMLYALMYMRASSEGMNRYQSYSTSRVYEYYRKEHAKNHSKVMKDKNLIPWNKGGVEITEEHRHNLRVAALNRKPKSKESIDKWRESRSGYQHSEETRLKQSLALKGKAKGPMSEEEKLKRSLSQKGKAKPKGFGDKVAERMKQSFIENNPNKREDLKKTCPHCGTKSGPSSYSRWHGDNCKVKRS
jgi:rubrerythrin